MERVCFMLKVKAELLEEYKARHKVVWPKMLQALRDTGWRNYSLFLSPEGVLVGYLETENFPAALAAMAKTEVNAQWQSEMQRFFENLDRARPDEGMRRLEEVFHLA